MHRALAEAIQLFESGLEQCHRSEDRKQIERYLAELGAILAAAVLGQSVISRLSEAERLFGHAWLIDQAPFESALAKWREFKAEYEEFAVRGLTVNERLHAFSSSDRYDQAEAARDSAEVRRILEAVRVDEHSIVRVINQMLGER